MRFGLLRLGGLGSLGAVLVLWLVVGGPALAEGDAASRAIAERIAGAVRFETVSYEDAADFEGAPFDALEIYLREQYPRTHAALRLEKVNGYTLLYEWPGTDPGLAPALFMSHTDVVPVAEAAAANWSQPPYGGVIEDGFVWGRGTLDVKTGVILWLEAVEALLAEGIEPRRTIYLSFGHDEEIGGDNGAKVVASLFAERGIQLAFLFDEGGMIIEGHPLLPERTVANVVTAEKAYYTVELTAHGISGHSSMPPRNTAIGLLARAIQRVEENPMPARISPPLREMLETASPHLPFGQRFAINNLWLMEGVVKRSLRRWCREGSRRTSFPRSHVRRSTSESCREIRPRMSSRISRARSTTRVSKSRGRRGVRALPPRRSPDLLFAWPRNRSPKSSRTP